MSSDKLFSESTLKILREVAKLKAPLPFTEAVAREILSRESHEAWLHPLAHLTHALLSHHANIQEPYLVVGQQIDESGSICELSCHCFYGTVAYNEYGIFVFENHGIGGMCPMTMGNMCAYHPYPRWLKPEIQNLMEASSRHASMPAKPQVVSQISKKDEPERTRDSMDVGMGP